MNSLYNFNQPQAQVVNTKQFDPVKFQQMLPNMNNNMLQQIIQQARAQGIPEYTIQEGLSYINSLRS